jgi:hypothetical protein
MQELKLEITAIHITPYLNGMFLEDFSFFKIIQI